jgi:hypothetical protein
MRARWAKLLRWPTGAALAIFGPVAWLAGLDHPESASESAPQSLHESIDGKFVFARLEFDSVGGAGKSHDNYDGRVWQRWETDFPEAEHNFLRRLDELTIIQPQLRALSRRLSADDLVDFPFLYMCDPGYMELSDDEKSLLRTYLLNGGFLWIDDFWGDGEWTNVEAHMSDVLPGVPWQEIPMNHPPAAHGLRSAPAADDSGPGLRSPRPRHRSRLGPPHSRHRTEACAPARLLR